MTKSLIYFKTFSAIISPFFFQNFEYLGIKHEMHTFKMSEKE